MTTTMSPIMSMAAICTISLHGSGAAVTATDEIDCMKVVRRVVSKIDFNFYMDDLSDVDCRV